MLEITIDTGGTFTDGVLIDGQQNISMAKFPTNPADPSTSIMGCIKLLAQERKLTEKELLASTSGLVIGTTFATNCILEGKGAKCCLLHTKGFKDIPELGRRIPKDDIYNIKVPPPPTLIPRYLRFAVEERIQFDGEILTPLNEDDVLKAMRRAKEENAEVPVICFLHSYINPVHEEKAAEIIKPEYPDVVVSSRILKRWIEWDRLTTATLAGYVKPALSRFVATLKERMNEYNFNGSLLFVTCAGGVATPEVCLDNPALLIGSGPSAGPLLGHFLAELSDFNNIMICDMGGTSFDVSMLPERRVVTTTQTRIGDYVSACEAVDVSSIGVGGGSIAWIDDYGILHVGPSSTGANPGPACYDKGGQMPTVTDADVVLGYIPADYFLGGTTTLDAGLAEKVIAEKIAKPLGIDVVEAAYAISSLIEANMTERIMLSAVTKGLDPQDFTVIFGGGAGPVHAVGIAAGINIRQLYIPRHAPVFCAFGIMVADYKHILSSFLYRRQDEVDVDEVKGIYHSLEEAGAAILAQQGVAEEDKEFIHGAEIRYFGQIHDIEVLLPATRRGEPITGETFKALIDGFHERHKAIYGRSDPGMEVIIGALKLQAIGERHHADLIKKQLFTKEASKDASAALKRKRRVYFKELGGFVETPCYDPDRLQYGNSIMGPAIVEERRTTIVLPGGAELTVDIYGNYLVRRTG